MLRLLSLILLLAGAAVAALGGWLYMGNDLPTNLLGLNQPALERKVLPAETAPSRAAEPSVPAPQPVVAAPPPPAPVAVAEAPHPEVINIEPEPAAAPEQKSTKATASMKTRSLSSGSAATPPTVSAPAPAPAAMPEPMETPVSLQPTFSPEVVAAPQSVQPVTAPPAPPTIEEQLYSVPIAYETPASASFNLPFTVTLAINAQEGATTASGGLSGADGNTVAETVIEVTDQVKAQLFGDAFTIELQSPDVQKLSKSTESVWRWKVTPTQSGPQDLTFEIFAIHPGDASERIRTFNDTVTVEVSRLGQAMFLAQQYNPIVVIVAGIGSLLAGLFGVLRFFRGS